jgi:hypothetical protein
MTIDLSSDLTDNNTVYCYHDEYRYNWYKISIDIMDGAIIRNEFRFNFLENYFTVIQLLKIKKTRIEQMNKDGGDYKTLLRLNFLFPIDYKNIPKLKEKLSTYLVFS